MGAYAWRIDPSGTVYNLTDNTNTFLTGQEVPPPPTAPQFVSSRDVDGDALVDTRYGNRTVTLNIRVVGSSQSDIEDRTQLLQAAITKLHREGGVLEGTSPAGTVFYLTVLDAQMTLPQGKRYMTRLIAEPTLEFTCSPFIYGSENSPSDHVETSSPCLIFTEASVAGDVPALGRLVVDEDQGADQAWLTWGLRSKTYSSDADAALYYDASGRTAQGAGATTSTAPSGYTGSGAILAGSLSNAFESILSTQATGGGSHHQHTGAYRVFARWQSKATNTGVVAVAFEWSVGDFRTSTRSATTYLTDTRASDGTPVEGSWVLVDHGIVRIPSGTTQWEGRFLASSTVQNDDVYLDHYFLVPADEGSGVSSALASSSAATSYTARDDFGGTGALATQSLTTGGTWTAPATPYETDDFSMSAGWAQRTATSDTSTGIRYGRWLYASGTSAMTNQQVLAGIYVVGVSGFATGVIARAVDKDNFLAAVIATPASLLTSVDIYKVVAGTATLLGSARPSGATTVDSVYPLYLTVTAGGGWQADVGGNRVFIASGYDSDLATGGALASGYAGIIDWNTSATATARKISWFYASAPSPDAAVFASQSAQVKYDGVTREDTTGTFWAPASDYTGDYMLVPPAGRESRTTQVIVKACRQDPYSGVDSNVDDISAKLYVTPRYLTVPT